MKFGDLATHAERCEQLASVCTDQNIAIKLRRLAKEYHDLAKQSTIVTPMLLPSISFSIPTRAWVSCRGSAGRSECGADRA